MQQLALAAVRQFPQLALRAVGQDVQRGDRAASTSDDVARKKDGVARLEILWVGLARLDCERGLVGAVLLEGRLALVVPRAAWPRSRDSVRV